MGGEGGGAKFRIRDLHWTLGPPLSVHTISCFIGMTTLAFVLVPIVARHFVTFVCLLLKGPAGRCRAIVGFGGFPKLGVAFWGVPIIRTIVFWGLFWGSLILGNYHLGSRAFQRSRFLIASNQILHPKP